MARKTGLKTNDRVQGMVELGPRTMAILRRILLVLEQGVSDEVPDPGQDYEFDDETNSA